MSQTITTRLAGGTFVVEAGGLVKTYEWDCDLDEAQNHRAAALRFIADLKWRWVHGLASGRALHDTHHHVPLSAGDIGLALTGEGPLFRGVDVIRAYLGPKQVKGET